MHQFARQFRLLVFLAWALPPTLGLTFLVGIEVFSASQLMDVLLSLPIVLFLVASLIFTEWYFGRYVQPVLAYLTHRTPAGAAEAEQRLRRFPLAFWSVFLGYALLAPTLIITSAHLHAGFEPQLIDWFRIHSIALIATIAVGLPVFIRFLDLFGHALSTTRLITPHVTVRTKVFLIGAVLPLLIETLLVQYFWARTGFFNMETLALWLGLALLAAAGALMLMRGFGQALQPLQSMLQTPLAGTSSGGLMLPPQSTDDLGVISGHFQILLDELRVHQQVLTVSNRIMHHLSTLKSGECFAALGNICAQAVDDDMCFLFLHDDAQNELLCVAYTGAEFNPTGHFHMSLNTPTLVAQCFNTRKTALYRATPEHADAPQLAPDVTPESALLVPLMAENELLGVLMSVNTQTRRNYSAGDVALIEGVAREAALIIKTRLLLLQRVHTEERFKQLNELSQVTLESIGEGVITTDPLGAVIYMNQTAAKLSGWTHTEARGVPLQHILLLRDETTHQNEAPDYYERLAKTSQSQHSVLVHRDLSKEFYVEINSTPLRNAKRQIIGAVLVLRDVTEMRRLVRKMSYQTSHDALTGLINRREFENCLATALENVRRSGASYVVCYIDLDQFKVVNDTCGHAAGDELVKQLSTKLASTLGEHDILARLGGDEFGVLLYNCTLERGIEVAAYLLENVKSLRFAWEDKTFNFAANVGVVPLNQGLSAITDVLRAADSACYVAKELGRNRIHIFHQNDLAMSKHHGQMQWMQRIQRALDENQFLLYFQPIVDLNDNSQPHHGEVLVRMLDSAGQIVAPARFLPAAERYHLMPRLDRWVIHKFLGWLKKQHLNGQHAPYFINVSGQTLSDGQFLDFVTDELKTSGVSANRIGFEITETAAIQNVAKATHFIVSLKSLGCRFSLDDFGSGVSSFTYLKNLPVDYLKIDGSFVADMAGDRINTAMVESINQIGHLMGIKTIAESVENNHTLVALRNLGVDYVQGYHLGRPQPLH